MQVALAILVVLPLCWGTAAGVDRLVDLAAAQLGRDRTNGPSAR
jgi:elongation factor P--beta-lysine ligase